ncbi:sensor domain-containing diguanylate cyclase [Paraburkholderia dinghuensis]|uniref:diguanylate cyclase n=1 Tax=Paraburkholderia dinghuensis TaxID=2305225 RepID=A0A3N6MXL0_9BURK|nr:sensor domain-containing diguanylate cyclase [Paraburkholderia dinghuensis]RQH08509.1 sensor domain-containing diguanylate cyclase [Paraburkholderia dinghuensis]
MPAAPNSPHENRRLAAVHKVRLLGTPAEERFDRITRLARRIFGVPMACIDIVGEKLAWLKSVQGFDGVEGLRKDSYCHYTVLDKDVCVIRDAREDVRVSDSALAHNWVFYAGVPLLFDGEHVGVLCIGDNTPRDFGTDEMDSLADLAAMANHELQVVALSESQVALALSNEELEMKARIDVLTHLWNRLAIRELLDAELAQPGTSSVAVLMIDVDYFKAINDKQGHAAGDQVLRTVAERLRAGARAMDAVGRYGGEEFLMVLSGVDEDEAVRVGERVREQVARTAIQFDEQGIAVTCSIGVAVAAGTTDADALIRRADDALYRAKAAGRNRVEIERAQGGSRN